MPIHLRRREEISHLPVEVVNESKISIGSHYVGRQVLRGLDDAEERKYLPKITDIDANDPEFRKKANNFWAGFTILVPSSGVVLNSDLGEDKEPVDVLDWVKYRWALKNKMVSNSQEEMEKDPRKRFYIFDPVKELKRKSVTVKSKIAAQVKLAGLFKDQEKMKRVLRVLSPIDRPDLLSKDELHVRIFEVAESDPAAFIDVVDDKRLDIKAQIAEMVEYNVLTQQGNQYIYIDEVIGGDIDKTVAYFLDKTNSSRVVAMNAKLNTAKEQERAGGTGSDAMDTQSAGPLTGQTSLG